jgi:hypothetical protein
MLELHLDTISILLVEPLFIAAGRNLCFTAAYKNSRFIAAGGNLLFIAAGRNSLFIAMLARVSCIQPSTPCVEVDD